jgi:uncharacterized protein YndB with AHSA1/START domain
MKMSPLVIALCVAPFTAYAQTAPRKDSHVEVTKVAAPEKALKFSALIPAKPADVWQAFTTSAGLNTWLWQDCTVDLREGGGWIVHYPGGKTGGGTIVSFRDGRQLVLHAMAPERFPEVRSVGTTAVFDFAPEGERTRVTLTQTGWQGKEWDDAYEYLASGNAQLLEQLYLRFARGPIKWQ